MPLLVTGGCGYIGIHTVLELLLAGYDVVVLDNLSNSSHESLKRIAKTSGKMADFIEGDVRDADLLNRLFVRNEFSAVLHFAGLKAVGESVEQPLSYYQNNVQGSLTLLDAMARANIRTFVFSSSATVYGDPLTLPIREDFSAGDTNNPYGASKWMVEQICRDLVASDDRWCIALLRYFNPVGAHDSGMIGEAPCHIPNNLMPYISQVAVGNLPHLNIFGRDFNTVDGTGVRDYIHVVDLALGHIKALDKLDGIQGLFTYNLGTGDGYSVLQILESFEEVTGITINNNFVPRRSGDLDACYADVSKAQHELGWVATRDLRQMIEDTWRWQTMNPNGYEIN